MLKFVGGLLVGFVLAAGSSVAQERFDSFYERLERDNERMEQEREREQQQIFRDEQRMERMPC